MYSETQKMSGFLVYTIKSKIEIGIFRFSFFPFFNEEFGIFEDTIYDIISRIRILGTGVAQTGLTTREGVW